MLVQDSQDPSFYLESNVTPGKDHTISLLRVVLVLWAWVLSQDG